MPITLDKMSGLVRSLIEAKEELDSRLHYMNNQKALVLLLEQETIPSAMQELGIDSYKLTTGETVSIKSEVSVGIPVKRKDEAYIWLEENGFGGIIKTEVVTSFTKGESDQAYTLANTLIKDGKSAIVERNVHYQTLKAFVLEQLVEGQEIPLELFGGLQYFTTKVKQAKS